MRLLPSTMATDCTVTVCSLSVPRRISDLLRSSIHKTFIKFDQQLRDERVLYQPVPGGGVTISGSGPLQYSGTTATTVFISDEDIIFLPTLVTLGLSSAE